MPDKRLITAVMIGAGDRGKDVYGQYALDSPGDIRFVAVAEPQPLRREMFGRQHQIPSDQQYGSWEALLARPKMADAAFICTQDRMHTAPALAALEKGYHVMLEKPMAPAASECRQLVQTAEARDLHLQIGHVFRYTPFFKLAHQVIHSGQLGELICLSQRENVGYFHMAHSFVRGNWRDSRHSNPMILAKCCHDMDILHWLVGSRASKVSSFGNLRHFRPENAPEGAPKRCTDGCPMEAECIFSAIDIYVRLTPLIRICQMSENKTLRLVANLAERYPRQLDQLARIAPPLRAYTEYGGWPVSIVTSDFTRQGRQRAIEDPDNPYGRCVYHCDNDVVDHQHVDVEFENGVTATLIMHGHSYAEGRTLRVDGSRATLIGELNLHGTRLELFDKRSGRRQLLLTEKLDLERAGHGGGDAAFMGAFVELVRGEQNPEAITDARGALESHLMAFAAERARVESRLIFMKEMR
ncbi:MAG: Gfo/Idh/MocA family oxidoreductase [Chloroflexota bacterium]|jgi:predicted dehydrogenase